jgi:two-component system LytT family response regulator
MKALIIDDEPLARLLVKEYLQNYPEIELAQECSDGFEGVKAIQTHQPDLIFLDIQMPKINGFEMLELIDHPPMTIFTTAFDEYAIKAFESHAVDYLLKPYSRERFDKALSKYLNQNPAKSENHSHRTLLEDQIQTQNSRIVVKTAQKIKIIPTADILYIEASDDYVEIFTGEGSYLKNWTMSYLEKFLDPDQFIRTHRSYFVNIQEITRIEPFEKESFRLFLKSGKTIPLSKTGHAKLKQILRF